MNTNSLAIYLKGLDDKECALFDRVISFSAKHGLEANTVDDATQADLFIIDLASFPSVAETAKNKVAIVVGNDENIESGDYKIVRPLMITKVMASLSEAIEVAKNKKSTVTTSNEIQNELQSELQTINIEDAPKTVNTEESIQVTTATLESAPTSSPHHALVIDDSAAIRKQLELELRDAGITTEFAESGVQALEIIKDKHFDLVFLDIIMPGLDGYETCKQMRAHAAYKKTPIVMLSGKTSPLDEVQGVIAGATTYLTKPVKSDKLQEVLNRLTKWIENYAPAKQTETA